MNVGFSAAVDLVSSAWRSRAFLLSRRCGANDVAIVDDVAAVFVPVAFAIFDSELSFTTDKYNPKDSNIDIRDVRAMHIHTNDTERAPTLFPTAA